MRDKIRGNVEFHTPASGRILQGSFKHFITIYTRQMSGTSLDNPDPEEILTTVYSTMGRVEVISPAKRFDGINTENDVTNVIINCNYDSSVFQEDLNTLFVDVEFNQFPGDQSRRYKLLKPENYMEESRFLRLYCMESGFTLKEASKI